MQSEVIEELKIKRINWDKMEVGQRIIWHKSNGNVGNDWARRNGLDRRFTSQKLRPCDEGFEIGKTLFEIIRIK